MGTIKMNEHELKTILEVLARGRDCYRDYLDAKDHANWIFELKGLSVRSVAVKKLLQDILNDDVELLPF